ncbi:hypothetical protein JCM39194_23040 [Desulfotomaculum varum]
MTTARNWVSIFLFGNTVSLHVLMQQANYGGIQTSAQIENFLVSVWVIFILMERISTRQQQLVKLEPVLTCT